MLPTACIYLDAPTMRRTLRSMKKSASPHYYHASYTVSLATPTAAATRWLGGMYYCGILKRSTAEMQLQPGSTR